jgi:rhodanese-related sulfurtransferase
MLLLCISAVAEAGDPPRISKEELKNMLGSSDLVIIDVRVEKELRKTGQKIKGAVWEDFEEVRNWASKYPKEKTIVLYCS